jgi:hypothetical protein
MPEEIPEGLAGARYKGHGAGLREGMKYYNTDGSLRKDTEDKRALSLEPGDEIMFQDEDVYGKTLWHDPNQNLPSKYVGLGKVIMDNPEHAGKSDQELREIGYEWHAPRPDVEPVEPLEVFLRRRKKEEPKEVPQSITIEQPPEEPDPRDAMYQEIEDMQQRIGTVEQESEAI